MLHGFTGVFGPPKSADGGDVAAAKSFVLRSADGARPVARGPLWVVGKTGVASRDSDGGDFLLALDGWLDNGDELRPALELGAEPASDAQIALAAFRAWGEEAPARLRGSYALAFWDGAARRLIFACDYLGRYAIYHARIGGALVFATGLRPLLALPGVSREINEPYLAAFLTDATYEPEDSFYAAIRRLPAASIATVDADGTWRLREYWRPDWSRRIRRRRDEDYVEEGRALLDQAVRRQLRGPGPVVCHMSGGLDSTAVAATAARLTAPGVVHTLTMAPAEGVAHYTHPRILSDERGHAAAVARLHPNMAWEAVSSPDLSPIDINPLRLLLPFGMPMRNIMTAGWFDPLRRRAQALGAVSTLVGGYGNLTLSWDGIPGLAGMARRGDWLRLWREAVALGHRQGVSPQAILRRYAVKPLLPARIQAWLAARRGQPLPDNERFSAIHPDFARATAIRERRLEYGAGYLADAAATRRLWLRRQQQAPAIASALGGLYGLRIRDPLSDMDLLEFCFAVPDEQYIRDGATRWLARRVLADRLPPEVLNERRRGLQCPEYMHRMTLQRDEIVAGVESLGRSPLASRVLDVARMKRLAENWPEGLPASGFNEYGAVLHRGLHVGRFLRWIEGGN